MSSLKTTSSRVCVLAGGGLDSAVLLARDLRAGKIVHPLYVRCGLIWEKAELHWLRRFLKTITSSRLKPLTVLHIPAEDLHGIRHWSVTGQGAPGRRSRDAAVRLPGRNLLLFSLAAVFCARENIPEVHVGTLKANPFSDASPAFLRAAARTASMALGKTINISAPFRTLSKKQVAALGRELPLHLTFSCLSPRGLQPCRRCNKCAERDKALKGM